MIDHLKIQIEGFGLIVNHPTAIIIKALKDAGYTVSLEKYNGQFQNVPEEEWIDHYNSIKINNENIKIKVNPLPWPG